MFDKDLDGYIYIAVSDGNGGGRGDLKKLRSCA